VADWVNDNALPTWQTYIIFLLRHTWWHHSWAQWHVHMYVFLSPIS
jgi:hypothetical protein